MLGVHEELHVGPVASGDDGGGLGVLGGDGSDVVAIIDLLVVTVVDGGVGKDTVVVPPPKVLLEADCMVLGDDGRLPNVGRVVVE